MVQPVVDWLIKGWSNRERKVRLQNQVRGLKKDQKGGKKRQKDEEVFVRQDELRTCSQEKFTLRAGS